ncbi:hypothetical protein N798_02525 [Knoellia flava TL1]|uniref:Uncharacterized protein n=2 Tax=Knoellia flava TaxID=913969 RepID=A0A8H9KPB9_9MICO|nr:hypothetical protein [Knoellia flava]KGN35505.1 hypothetical protein N798_02525 [Knoellia flava TL1]GGB68593.1 hypothetical protein GCM10011314_04840 [Knoellia flava]
MAGVNDAIGAATRLGEIGFVEFTTKLVSDVFDTLVASNLRQQQAFIELLQATSKSLTAYVNETKDDIGPGEIMQLLTAVAPRNKDTVATSNSPTAIIEGGKLSPTEVETVNKAVAITDPSTGAVVSDPKPAKATLDKDAVDAITAAVAQRIAANKYTLLKEMVKLGMLRLVVTDGTIESGLNFHSYGSDFLRNNSSRYSSQQFQLKANAQTGSILSAWVKASASTAYTSVNVSTSNTASGSSSGVDVTITGGVKINFKTDYLPLDTP